MDNNQDQSSNPLPLAICAAAPSSGQEDPESKDKQPTNIKGLLKFALDATKNEDPTQESSFKPLDEDKRRFLEQAIHSLTINVVEILLQQIEILKEVDGLTESDDAAKYTTALDTISEYVYDMDTANDFYKIGGFVVLIPCMKCKNPKVRTASCNLVAELCQNNPYCQNVVVANGFLQILLNIVETDTDTDSVVKALYAISCIIRQNTSGCTQFIQYQGVQTFLEILQKDEDRFNIKICFLLSALCSTYNDFRNRLVFVGYIPALLSLLKCSEHKTSHEYILDLLFKLVQDNASTINEQDQTSFKEILTSYLSVVKDNQDFQVEEELCHRILGLVCPD